MERLSAAKTQALLAKLSTARAKAQEICCDPNGDLDSGSAPSLRAVPKFSDLLLYKKIKAQASIAKQMGILNPFMQSHDGMAKAKTHIGGREFLNFATYDYLGLNGDPRVNKAASAALLKYGTSAGASRLVAGQRVIHEELEKALAAHYGQEAALCFVSGHATNVAVISTLFDKDDLIIYDRLSHNSILLGAKYSGATCMAFAHNDMKALSQILKERRVNFKKALIVSEGVFSMDGDIANLPELVALKREYAAFLMLDEAHALGVIGKTGRGTCEHFGIDEREVDIHMGTLSKTLCSCGGYIAGSSALIEILKYQAASFVYSVGLSPVLAASSLRALELLHFEQSLVIKQQENAKYALKKAQELGFNTGSAQGTAVLPIIVGSSVKAAFLSNLLYEQGVLALPIVFPAVEEGKARLRLFISASHAKADIDAGLEAVFKLWNKACELEGKYVKKPTEAS